MFLDQTLHGLGIASIEALHGVDLSEGERWFVSLQGMELAPLHTHFRPLSVSNSVGVFTVWGLRFRGNQSSISVFLKFEFSMIFAIAYPTAI